MAFGIQACIICLACEAALVATYATPEALTTPNQPALRAAVSILFIYILTFEVCLGGPEYVYMSELCPTHLRAKGMALGMAAFCVINIIWLQVAPVAFAHIGWKFYLCFIVPGTLGAIWMATWFPDTRGLPLEEIADIFGDREQLYGEVFTDGIVINKNVAEKTAVTKTNDLGRVESA